MDVISPQKHVLLSANPNPQVMVRLSSTLENIVQWVFNNTASCFYVIYFISLINTHNINYTCCSHSGSGDNPDQNNFQKNFTKT